MSGEEPQDLGLAILPPGWEWSSLQELAAAEPNALTDGPFGSKLKSAHYVSAGVRVVRLGNLGVGEFKDEDKSFITESHYETLTKHAVLPGDLLIAALAEPVGRCCEVPENLGPAIVKADCVRFSPHKAIERRLVMNWLNSPRGKKNSELLSHGIGRLRMNLGNMREVPVPTPPLNEQRRIVAKIEALQARSKAAKDALDAIPPLLEKFRQSVLAAAFRGDLTRSWRERQPEIEPASAVIARTPTPPRPSRYKSRSKDVVPGDHGLSIGDPGSPTPPGWSWVSLLDIARLESGHTPSRNHPEYWDGEIPWVSIPDARDSHGRTIYETRRCVTQAGLDNSASRLLPAGAVFLCRTAASIGYTLILGKPMATSQDLVAWLATPALNPDYLMWLFIAEKQAILRFGKGSAHKTVYFPEILSFHICLPPVAEQARIVREVESRMALADALESAQVASGSLLPSLDQSILAKAFRGELVPQDPNDEPASVLLERIRAEREAAGPAKTRRRTKT